MNPFNSIFGDMYQKVKRHETGGVFHAFLLKNIICNVSKDTLFII